MWDPVSRKGEARGCFPNWGSGFPNMKGKPGLAKTFFEGTRSLFKETGLSSRKQTGSPFQNKTGCSIWETWSSLTGDCREAGSPFQETGSHFREVGSFYLLTKWKSLLETLSPFQEKKGPHFWRLAMSLFIFRKFGFAVPLKNGRWLGRGLFCFMFAILFILHTDYYFV